MRNAIKEFIELSEEEKKRIWSNAIFVFDTNVFLNLYRYSKKTREQLFKAFKELNGRIWMPNHVAHEFMKDRYLVILEAITRYEELNKAAEKFLKTCLDQLRLSEKDNEFIEAHNFIFKWLHDNKVDNLLVETPSNDLILDQLLVLFEDKVGIGFTDEELTVIKKEGAERYNKQIPPGYKDASKQKGDTENNCYGDFIIWKEILRFSKENKVDIIYVTSDQKEDWWNIVKGQKIGPRIELRKEFECETLQRFNIYTMSSFLSIFENGNDVQIDKSTIDEVELFSKVIRHEDGTRQQLSDYYQRLESEEEITCAKLRFKIMRAKEKNRKRMKQIETLSYKYPIEMRTDEISNLIRTNEAHIEKTNRDIEIWEGKLRMIKGE